MSSAADKERRIQARRKEDAELHTKFLNEGLTATRIKPFAPVDAAELDAAESELAAFKAKPVFELWCTGELARWHVLHWAMEDMSQSHRSAVAGLGRFLLRAAKLNVPTSKEELGSEAGSVKRVCIALKSDTGIDVAAAEVALSSLHATMRKAAVFDAPTFIDALQPLLTLLPNAAVTADAFLGSSWGKELARGQACISKPFAHEQFLKPMLLAVGGFGVVDIAWNEIWAKPYALKRQNMAMLVSKGHVEKLKIEWRVHREVLWIG